MVRINLLPRELQERRKYERFYPLVFLASVALLLLVLGAWGLAAFQASQRANDLQKVQETAQQLRTQADAFSVFERKEGELQAREVTARAALTGRINWARIATELSMVLPDEIFVRHVRGNEGLGLEIEGTTPNDDPGGADDGYKSIAKALVRINALQLVDDVWLLESAHTEYPAENGIDAVQFRMSAAVRSSAATPTP